MLRIAGQAIVLIEAKLGSLNGTLAGKTKAQRFGTVRDFLKRYRRKAGEPDPLNRKWIKEQPDSKIFEQLCRNVVFAQWLAAGGEQAHVVNLVSAAAPNDESHFQMHLLKDTIRFHRRTWEDLYTLDIIRSGPAAMLRLYFENKTVRLIKAFAI